MVRSYRVDLPTVSISRRGTKGTGFEPNLWSFQSSHVAEESRHDIETQLFQRIDDDASKVHKKFLDTPIADLSEHDRSDWARFLMSLRMRQPKIVAQIKKWAAEHFRTAPTNDRSEYEIAPAGWLSPPTLVEFTEKTYPGLIEEIALHFYPKLVDHQAVGQKLVELQWGVRDVSHVAARFLISDEPWIIEDSLDDPDLILALPLSPTRVFFGARIEKAYAKMMDCHADELVRRVNRASYVQSVSRIYGQDESFCEFLELCASELGEVRLRTVEKTIEWPS